METGKKQIRSGSKWYRLPQHNLNIATADHLFRTHEPEGTHSLGEGLPLPFNRLQQEVLTALWAQTQTAEGSFSVRLSKAERSGTADSLQHLAPEPPSSTLLSSGDGKAKHVLPMWADAAQQARVAPLQRHLHAEARWEVHYGSISCTGSMASQQHSNSLQKLS